MQYLNFGGDTVQPVTIVHMTITTTHDINSGEFFKDRTKCSKLILMLGSQSFLVSYELMKIQIPGTLNDFTVT